MASNTYVESAADRFDYATDWKEIIADTGAPGGTLSRAEQTNTRQGFVKFNKLRSAARYFLGFSYADTAAPWRLRREQPQWDSQFPWMYAHNFSFTPVVPKANTANPNNSPYEESPFSNDNWNSLYEWALVTVQYRSFRCLFLQDEDIPTAAEEWKRNTLFTTVPQIEILSADGTSQLAFAETSVAAPPIAAGPALGTAFPAPLGVLMPKLRLQVEWLDVAFEYLSSNPNVFLPTKIINCLGKVNSTEFLGFPAGTLLCQPYEYVENTMPVASDTQTQSVYDVLTSVDLRLSFDHFDPTPGATSPATRGHNLMPWRQNGRWYLATRDGTNSLSKTLLEYTDFNKIFTHVGAP